jgi:hypothetical protein
MSIELGELIGETIAIMCFHKSTIWSGTMKFHLKNPDHHAGRWKIIERENMQI